MLVSGNFNSSNIAVLCVRLWNLEIVFLEYFIDSSPISVQERDTELSKEAQRQEENDKLRKEFAKHANAFHQLLTDTRWVALYSQYFFHTCKPQLGWMYDSYEWFHWESLVMKY